MSIENSDSFDFSQNNMQLSFDLSMRLRYYDGFDFSIDLNSDTCLSFEYPVHTQIWLGADKFEVKSNTLDLQTLTACNADVTFDTHGEPEVD